MNVDVTMTIMVIRGTILSWFIEALHIFSANKHHHRPSPPPSHLKQQEKGLNNKLSYLTRMQLSEAIGVDDQNGRVVSAAFFELLSMLLHLLVLPK